MASPYSSVSVINYNLNPPPDDGSETAANTVKYSTPKIKLADPLKTAFESMNTNVVAAFAKMIGGTDVSAVSANYDMQTTDQGKLIYASNTGITITTPDATAAGSPFVAGVLNTSGNDITLDGKDSQTVNGATTLTIKHREGGLLFTDGANWFLIGVPGPQAAVPSFQVFASSGTFTKPTKLRYVRTTVVGGGGGGGGSLNTDGYGGGGGGAGGSATKFIAASAVGATETVTVGAGGAGSTGTGGTGGTSSFGAHCSATGGSGGGGGTTSAAGAGGAGGSGSSGNVNFVGGRGGGGGGVFTEDGGGGGASIFGAHGGGGQESTAGTGGSNYGGGGGGAGTAGPSSLAGGAGGGGVVIVEVVSSD